MTTPVVNAQTVHYRKTTLLDNLNIIPKFSGSSDSVNFTEFSDTLESVANHLEWVEADKVFVLKMRLIGKAAEIFKARKDKKYEEIMNILKERFTKKESPELAIASFFNFKQNQSTSVQDFFDRATELSKKVLVEEGVDKKIAEASRDSILHTMLLANLLPSIRRGVITRDPKTPQEILKLALLEEKACRSLNPFYNVTGEVEQTSNPQPQMACAVQNQQTENLSAEVSLLREQINLLTAKFNSMMQMPTAQNVQNHFNCYECGQPGHMARQCPNRQNYYDHQQEYFENNYRGRGAYGNHGNFRGGRGNNSNRGGQNSNAQRENFRGRNGNRGRGALSQIPQNANSNQGN